MSSAFTSFSRFSCYFQNARAQFRRLRDHFQRNHDTNRLHNHQYSWRSRNPFHRRLHWSHILKLNLSLGFFSLFHQKKDPLVPLIHLFSQQGDKSPSILSREENASQLRCTLAKYIPLYTFIYDFSLLFFQINHEANLNRKDREWLQTRFGRLMTTFVDFLEKDEYSRVFYSPDVLSYVTQESISGETMSGGNTFFRFLQHELKQVEESQQNTDVSNTVQSLYKNQVRCIIGLIVENVDSTASFPLFEQAAQEEFPFAVWKCGMMLDVESERTPKAEKEMHINGQTLRSSQDYIEFAAQKGFADAFCDCARLEQDDSKKIELLERASSKGSVRALHELGLVYNRDHVKRVQYAYPLLEQAANLHYPPALYSYGKLCFNNMIAAKSSGEGVYMLEQSAAQGFPDSMYFLSYVYDKFDSNLDDSFNMLTKAARNGMVQAQFDTAMCYNVGSRTGQNLESAFEFFKLAAENGHEEAQFHVATFYELGRGVDQNYTEALYWFNKLATEHHHIPSEYKVGVFLMNGWGTDKDDQKGEEWIRNAAEHGNADACVWIGNHSDSMYDAYDWYMRAIHISPEHEEARHQRRVMKYKLMNHERKLSEKEKYMAKKLAKEV
mmetsp:Transcript_1812/g.6419  ORF Transcript_1812/g.6419 Transcript_1812/m.6419 type:complete len:610 (-) Transcript_1812:8731-10560(-)